MCWFCIVLKHLFHIFLLCWQMNALIWSQRRAEAWKRNICLPSPKRVQSLFPLPTTSLHITSRQKSIEAVQSLKRLCLYRYPLFKRPVWMHCICDGISFSKSILFIWFQSRFKRTDFNCDCISSIFNEIFRIDLHPMLAGCSEQVLLEGEKDWSTTFLQSSGKMMALDYAMNVLFSVPSFFSLITRIKKKLCSVSIHHPFSSVITLKSIINFKSTMFSGNWFLCYSPIVCSESKPFKNYGPLYPSANTTKRTLFPRLSFWVQFHPAFP